MKIDEIMLAVVPGEEATEEENDIVKKGREEIKKESIRHLKM